MMIAYALKSFDGRTTQSARRQTRTRRVAEELFNTAAAARFLTGSGGPDLLILRAPDDCCKRRLLPPNAEAIRGEIEARMAAG